MDKKELKRSARTTERFKDIMNLRKSKEYDKIFEVYGQTIFKLAVPRKHQKAEVKELFEKGRWEDIYRKYGENTYNKYIYKMQEQEIYNETGSKPKSILNRIKNVFVHRIAPVMLSTALLTPPVAGGTLDFMSKQEKAKNATEYAEEIEGYNKKINEYAKEIQSMNLDDLQIFMKVMSDMWSEIDGYATAETEPLGFSRLALYIDKVGVCRNFADDITAKLNAINPEYNARNIVVYMSGEEYNLANIDRNIIETNETVAGEDKEQESGDGIVSITGNHMVTAVDVPDENITLILDPTNPGIGVFRNGQIYMFSTPDGKGIESRMIGQFFQGAETMLDLGITELKSCLPCEYSLEELEEMYGTEKQNEVLEYLEALENDKIEQEDFVPKVTVDEKQAIENAKVNRNNSDTINKSNDIERD